MYMTNWLHHEWYVSRAFTQMFSNCIFFGTIFIIAHSSSSIHTMITEFLAICLGGYLYNCTAATAWFLFLCSVLLSCLLFLSSSSVTLDSWPASTTEHQRKKSYDQKKKLKKMSAPGIFSNQVTRMKKGD